MTPLYNYSEQNPYLIDDYPYGFKLRCKIRFWVEYSPKKGFRFCSQTENPKNGMWNKPKKSTYTLIAMNMYLDEENHIQHRIVSEYSSASDVLQFVKDFPETDKTELLPWCMLKVAYLRKCISGETFFTINGEKKPWTDIETEEHRKDEAMYMEALKLLRDNK